MGPMLKGSLYTLTAIVMSQIAVKVYEYWRRRRGGSSKTESKNKKEIMEAYFFPDKDVACRAHFLGNSRCFKENCKYSHGTTSLSELYRYLNSCRKSMDVCVYVMTSVDLTSIVLSMHKRGVAVRVITDDEQEKIDGSQIWSLRKAGIPVRTDHSSNFMHHKFVIVDGQILVNGSFNWTRNAITSNQENVIITNHRKIVSSFQAEFEKLWQQFDPSKMYDTELRKWKRDEREVDFERQAVH